VCFRGLTSKPLRADGLNQDGTVSVANTERVTDPVNGQIKNITGQYCK
jgi:hypothetical protein